MSLVIINYIFYFQKFYLINKKAIATFVIGETRETCLFNKKAVQLLFISSLCHLKTDSLRQENKKGIIILFNLFSK